MATYTFTPTAAGWLESGETVDTNAVVAYNNCRTGVGNVQTANPAHEWLLVGEEHDAVGYNKYRAYESFMRFDTSPIPDTETVLSVTLSMYLQLKFVGGSPINNEARIRTKSWTPPLTFAQWVDATTLTGYTQLASFNGQSEATGQYHSFTSEADFLTAIQLDTNTDVLMACKNQEDATRPTGDNFLRFDAGPDFGGTYPVKLVVVTDGADSLFMGDVF